jgi:hypothetical protein
MRFDDLTVRPANACLKDLDAHVVRACHWQFDLGQVE